MGSLCMTVLAEVLESSDTLIGGGRRLRFVVGISSEDDDSKWCDMVLGDTAAVRPELSLESDMAGRSSPLFDLSSIVF